MNNETTIIDLSKVDLAEDARPHDPAALEMLANDMKQEGQLQEIIVEAKGGRYIVISGVGRTLAARKLGWSEIRASVRENVSDFERARITFAENEDREDVDPYYQAMLIAKMMKTESCTQLELAQKLGISEALVSIYLSVGRLPAKIQEKFRRLNLGQLTQIVRLNNEKEQIYLAQKCVKNDLSVRQAKAWVDKRLGVAPASKGPNKGRPARPEIPDPLEATWDKIRERGTVPPEYFWEADYGTHMVGKERFNGWFFFVRNPASFTEEDIARWFNAMASSMTNRNAPAPSRMERMAESLKPVKEAMKPVAEAAKAIGISEVGAPRLPKTPAERQELEEIARRGTPKDVYAWIYGANNLMTSMVPYETWNDAKTSPEEGLKKILAGVSQANN